MQTQPIRIARHVDRFTSPAFPIVWFFLRYVEALNLKLSMLKLRPPT